jgi:uncharacterized protein YbcI
VPDSAHDQGPLLAEVTNAVVQLHRRHFGKGPTRSKTYFAGDLVLCVMQDLFTIVERTLIAAGEGDRVRSARVAVYDAVGPELRDAVGRILGRRVVTSTSQVQLEPEMGMVVFVLDAASGAAAAD